MFSVENLLKPYEEGQSGSTRSEAHNPSRWEPYYELLTRFSGHSKSDDNNSDEETPSFLGNCLSFSRSPINKLMKLTRDLNVKENHPTPLLQAGVKRSSTSKLCRFCGTVTPDIFCANCGNVVNKRGRY